MDLNYIYATAHSFLISHQLIALGLLIALAFWLWKKPYEFLKFILAVLALAAAIYAFSFLNDSAFVGSQNKHEITTELEDKLLEK